MVEDVDFGEEEEDVVLIDFKVVAVVVVVDPLQAFQKVSLDLTYLILMCIFLTKESTINPGSDKIFSHYFPDTLSSLNKQRSVLVENTGCSSNGALTLGTELLTFLTTC